MKPRRLHSETILSIVTTSVAIGGCDASCGGALGAPVQRRCLALWVESAKSPPRKAIVRCDADLRVQVQEGPRVRGDAELHRRPADECEVCGAPVQRVFHPVAVHFKGSGFYNTDYGTKRRAREAKEHKESSSRAPPTARRASSSDSSSQLLDDKSSDSVQVGSSDSKSEPPRAAELAGYAPS